MPIRKKIIDEATGLSYYTYRNHRSYYNKNDEESDKQAYRSLIELIMGIKERKFRRRVERCIKEASRKEIS